MFEIALTDDRIELVELADSYVLEGPLTTFFVGDGRSGKLSAFSQRVASFRTDGIVSIRRIDPRPATPLNVGSDAVESAEVAEPAPTPLRVVTTA